MTTLIKLEQASTVTSLELCKQINAFRVQFNPNKPLLQHKTLLEKIDKRITAYSKANLTEQKILPSSYKDASGKRSKMYILPDTDAKMIAASEVPVISVLVGKWIDSLKAEIKAQKKEIQVLQRNHITVLMDRMEHGDRDVKGFIMTSMQTNGISGLVTDIKEVEVLAEGKSYKKFLMKAMLSTFNAYKAEFELKQQTKLHEESVKAEKELSKIVKEMLQNEDK